MQDNNFYRLGAFIYRVRWLVIAIWVGMIMACLPILPDISSPFKTMGFLDESAKSTQVDKKLASHLGYNSQNNIIITYSSSLLSTDNPQFFSKIKRSLSGLKNFPIKSVILYPSSANTQQISKNKHTAFAVVILQNKKPLQNDALEVFKSLIKKPAHMAMEIGGELPFTDIVDKQTQKDLFKADYIATPVAIITLLLVFGSVVAALLPIFVGGACALFILTVLYMLGHVLQLSVFTLNIAMLLGLCLSLDYALFIVSRFRDELKRGLDIHEAISVTLATAGKAIFYSGLAVFISLSALLLFPINILFSVAIGGLSAVFIAVVSSLVFLPAILSILRYKLNFLSLSFLTNRAWNHFNFWHWLAMKVVGKPLRFLIPILMLLVILASPIRHAQFGVSDFRILPQHSKSLQFFETYSDQFDENSLTPISIVVTTQGKILSEENIERLIDFSDKLKRNHSIQRIDSIVSVDERLNKSQYFAMYHTNKAAMPPEMKKLLATTTGKHFTIVQVVSKYPSNSQETKALITALRTMHPGEGMSIALTGTPVINDELLQGIAHRLPLAIAWIMVFTYIILLLLLRSLLLPLKAIFMTLISLAVCYGVLVLVFQEGYLHQLLNFQPQGMLDISLLVIIFCALFGFSMDYEVFLLSRIRECYITSHDTEQSIIFGIEKSSRIITSAAIIVIFICCSFLVADVLMVKAFGLGIAIAIFVDAFLIRTILVPAIMALLGDWNWYLPKWMGKHLPRFTK